MQRRPGGTRRAVLGVLVVAMVTALSVGSPGCALTTRTRRTVLTPRPYPARAPDDAGIRYGPGSKNLLDLYEPPGSARDRPLIVFVHGGGLVWGDRSMVGPAILRFAEAEPPSAEGYVVASVGYPLLESAASKVTLEGLVKDVRLAIQFLQDHADEYGIDPDRVVVAGASAGGYLATMAAIADGAAWEPVPGRTTKVDGFVDRVGPTDIDAYVMSADTSAKTTAGHQLFAGGFSMLARCTPKDGAVPSSDPCRARLRAASPLAHADPDDPAGYLVCGAADDIVPCRYARPLATDRDLSVEVDMVKARRVNGHDSSIYGLDLTGLAAFLDRVTSSDQ